jgi:hypothetical protein
MSKEIEEIEQLKKEVVKKYKELQEEVKKLRIYVSRKVETRDLKKYEEFIKEVERLEENEVILADEVMRLEQENTELKERVKYLESIETLYNINNNY